MSQADDLKHDLNEELSHLVRSYEDEGLPPSQISDSLELYSEVAEKRESPQRERVRVRSD